LWLLARPRRYRPLCWVTHANAQSAGGSDWDGFFDYFVAAAVRDAMKQALTMLLEERVNRWVRMIDQLQFFDVPHWCRTCLRAIEMVAVSQPNGDSSA